jgi:hypothetical protein
MWGHLFIFSANPSAVGEFYRDYTSKGKAAPTIMGALQDT